jgi:hypothetical protein
MVWISYFERDRHMSIEGMRARKATKTRLPNALQYFPHTLFCTSLRLVEGATEREPSLNPWSVRNIWSVTKLINQSTATSKRCHSLGPLFLLDNNLDWPSLFLISFDRRSEQGLDVPFHCLPLTTVKVTGLDHHAGKWG